MLHFNNEVWFVSAEMAPLVKAGGLGDVIGSLPKYLIKAGINARVVIPYYKKIIKPELIRIENNYPAGRVNFSEIPFDFGLKTARTADGVPLVLIEQDHFFNREDVYGPHGGNRGYKDNLWRFAMLAHGLAYAMRVLGSPMVVHTHDWSGGYAPAVIKQSFGEKKIKIFGRDMLSAKLARHVNADGLRPAIIFTIHNLGYQGVYGLDDFYDIGLDYKYNTSACYEHFGTLNSLKGGLLLSDMATTVSPTYAREITTPGFGFGLDGELKKLYNNGKLKGILNGIDLDYWNPKTDKMIYHNLNIGRDSYKLTDYNKWSDFKLKNKKSLLSELSVPLKYSADGKPMPLIGVVSRFAPEKGIEALLDALFNYRDFPFHLVLLGSGDRRIENKARYLSEIYKDRVFSMAGRYDETMSHKIYAASDIFVMPSRTEPCGLSQMISMRYGGVVVAGDTGGLHDTVTDLFSVEKDSANGILVKYIDSDGVIWALKKLYDIYAEEGDLWKKMVINAANKHFGWDSSAQVYENLYYDAINA